MARIRTIKPDFWKHEDLSALPEATHMLAAALLNYADDDGYFNANPRLVQSECSPLREPSVSIHESLQRLACIGYLRLGKGADGKTYGHIITFLEHQRVSHPTPSKIKELDINWDSSVNPPGSLQEASALNRIELNGIELSGGAAEAAPKPRKSKKQPLPSDYTLTETLLEKVKAALRKAGKPDVNYKTEFVRFCNHFWNPDARNRLKSDWDGAYVNWCLSEFSKPAEQSRGGGGASYESPSHDPDTSWHIKAKSYAAMLEKGVSLGSGASDNDIRRMVREGMITRELAEKRGYDLWRAA